eukprot:1334485-Amorphochlora_amoeboformis.AAC.1
MMKNDEDKGRNDRQNTYDIECRATISDRVISKECETGQEKNKTLKKRHGCGGSDGDGLRRLQ